MSVDDVLRQELYHNAAGEETAVDVNFVPFFIIPRVEVEFIRIVKVAQ